MERIAFKFKLKSGKLNEYIQAHNNVWPEMLNLLEKAGIFNYTIWNNGDEIFGYYETEDVCHASETVSQSEINTKWQKEMDKLRENARQEMNCVFSFKLTKSEG